MKKITFPLCLFLTLLLNSACNSSGAASAVILEDGLQDNEHRVFVTSTRFLGDFDGDPDATCESLRTSAGLTRTYAAIVSTSTVDANEKIVGNGGAVYLFNDAGTPLLVAASVDALWNTGVTPLSQAINLDENGDAIDLETLVFTGSDAAGEKLLSGGDYCADWSSSAPTFIRMGTANGVNGSSLSHLTDACHTSRRLYCISQ